MSVKTRTNRNGTIGVALATALAIGIGGVGCSTSDDSPDTAKAASSQKYGGEPSTKELAAYNSEISTLAAPTISRKEVLRRAKTWLTAYNGRQVPYSQGSNFRGYRQDCSGYVSMTLGLGKPGTNTVGLATHGYTNRISLKSLKPGDLLIDYDGNNYTRHVVIFEKWANSSRSSYWAYEQRGGHGTDHRKVTYGLKSGTEYKPYRPVNLRDGGGSTPPSNPKLPSWPVLQKGKRGVDVTAAQYLLRSHGHKLSTDGIFGSDTRSKVRSFQGSRGLSVDGVVGKNTWSKLIRTVRSGSRGDAVRALQKELNTKGYRLSVDGVFGAGTKSAVRSFQKKKNLDVDGIVGPQTWQALIGS
ncbi:peptidoglycan-binding protein [Streptomyces sp. E11-3]|uniref:C40 family peptidase n=1 Tax=Streptomyces sp. E11-3 TaxID=3110112 RepID=UPI003980AC53